MDSGLRLLCVVVCALLWGCGGGGGETLGEPVGNTPPPVPPPPAAEHSLEVGNGGGAGMYTEGEVVPIIETSGSYLRIEDSAGSRGWARVQDVWRLDRKPQP